MPAVKRTLEVAELYARRQAHGAPQEAKRLRLVPIPQEQADHAQAPKARTPLADITPPGSAVEAQEEFPVPAFHRRRRVPSIPDDKGDVTSAEVARPGLAGALSRLSEDEAKDSCWHMRAPISL